MALKTHYKYIHFVKLVQRPKTSAWRCRNNRDNSELGIVDWYSPWRQYCYFPGSMSVHSTGCLDDIGDFIRQLAQDRQEEL